MLATDEEGAGICGGARDKGDRETGTVRETEIAPEMDAEQKDGGWMEVLHTEPVSLSWRGSGGGAEWGEDGLKAGGDSEASSNLTSPLPTISEGTQE